MLLILLEGQGVNPQNWKKADAGLEEKGYPSPGRIEEGRAESEKTKPSLNQLDNTRGRPLRMGNKTLDTHVRKCTILDMDALHTSASDCQLFRSRTRSSGCEYRWPGGNVTCPRCGGAKHSFIKTRRMWFCYVCKKQFTVKVGNGHGRLADWPRQVDDLRSGCWRTARMESVVMNLRRALGIRQNSAWFMLHRIREAMRRTTLFKIGGNEGGPVESG